MLMLVDELDRTYYRPRVYVVAETDKMSSTKALRREQEWAQGNVGVYFAAGKTSVQLHQLHVGWPKQQHQSHSHNTAHLQPVSYLPLQC
jgi:hypothetical protein